MGVVCETWLRNIFSVEEVTSKGVEKCEGGVPFLVAKPESGHEARKGAHRHGTADHRGDHGVKSHIRGTGAAFPGEDPGMDAGSSDRGSDRVFGSRQIGA